LASSIRDPIPVGSLTPLSSLGTRFPGFCPRIESDPTAIGHTQGPSGTPPWHYRSVSEFSPTGGGVEFTESPAVSTLVSRAIRSIAMMTSWVLVRPRRVHRSSTWSCVILGILTFSCSRVSSHSFRTPPGRPRPSGTAFRLSVLRRLRGHVSPQAVVVAPPTRQARDSRSQATYRTEA